MGTPFLLATLFLSKAECCSKSSCQKRKTKGKEERGGLREGSLGCSSVDRVLARHVQGLVVLAWNLNTGRNIRSHEEQYVTLCEREVVQWTDRERKRKEGGSI